MSKFTPQGATFSPTERFRDFVAPAYERYRANPTSELDAKGAVDAIASLVDWAFWYYLEHDKGRLAGNTTDADFRNHMHRLSRDLQAISDAADAAKHRFLIRRKEQRIAYSSTAVFDPNGFAVDGRDLEVVAAGAMAFWRQWLSIT